MYSIYMNMYTHTTHTCVYIYICIMNVRYIHIYTVEYNVKCKPCIYLNYSLPFDHLFFCLVVMQEKNVEQPSPILYFNYM